MSAGPGDFYTIRHDRVEEETGMLGRPNYKRVLVTRAVKEWRLNDRPQEVILEEVMDETTTQFCNFNMAHPHDPPVMCTAAAERDGLCGPHWKATWGHFAEPGKGVRPATCLFCRAEFSPAEYPPARCPERIRDQAHPFVYLAPDGSVVPFTKDGSVEEDSFWADTVTARKALMYLMSLMPTCPHCQTATCLTWAAFWLKEVAGPRGLLGIMARMVNDLGGGVSFSPATLDSEETKGLVLTRQETEESVEVYATTEEEARETGAAHVPKEGEGGDWPEWISD